MGINIKRRVERDALSLISEETKNLISFGNKHLNFSSLVFGFLLFGFIFVWSNSAVYSQNVYQPNTFTQNQNYTNYMANSTVFNQEIARMEINVVRHGKAPMSITEVPRLEKGDVLKVRLLDEQVNGLKPDQSNFDWTFLVAFINPGRNTDDESSVSEEIQFRKRGWYKEYSFTVPYDSQPVFFLYPKPQYRAKILNLINKNQEEIRKIGEKTIEIAGAYAKIGGFLNELQGILYKNQYNSPYGNYGSYGSYGTYGNYGNYGNNSNFSMSLFMDQAVERLAQSFNIQLPSCWNGGYGGTNNYGSYNYGNSNNYGGINNYGGRQDFVGRAQCVAKSVSLEDFDVSISRMLQQGGLLAAAQLSQKYPQIAFWINIAAAALDFILKITKKSPLKLVPTIISSSQNQAQNLVYQQNLNNQNIYSGAAYNSLSSNSGTNPNTVKISLYAESQPRENGFVTAYPIVIHKWQANPDPETISLPTPTLMEPCLHAGQNILRSTDLINDWMSDTFTKDFRLVVSSSNGFRKEFPLKKNSGMGGWELNVTPQDLQAFPKINMVLESEVIGRRGFNEIKSPKFDLPVAITGTWELEPRSQKAFAVGGKRIVTLRNQLGSCKCLEAVIYKPSFGGQFVFVAGNKENGLIFSEDGKEVSFEIDATHFQPGQGQLQLQTYGGDQTNLNINLYPLLPNITGLTISKGDKQAVITGEGLEQIQSVKINGKRMIITSASLNTQNTSFSSNQISAGSFNANPAAAHNFTSIRERAFVFEDPNVRQELNAVSLELELEGGRNSLYPKTFTVSAARPLIIVNEIKEEFSRGNKSKISINVRNALTDFDFKAENLQIETRIENGQINTDELLKVSFQVMDWKNIQLSLLLDERFQKSFVEGKLQFRIRDKERGMSEWYTIQKPSLRSRQALQPNPAK